MSVDRNATRRRIDRLAKIRSECRALERRIADGDDPPSPLDVARALQLVNDLHQIFVDDLKENA